MAHVRAEAADRGMHFLSGLGMRPEVARQREEFERGLQRDGVRGDVLGHRDALGLLVALRLSQLDVRAEGADQELDELVRLRIGADLALLRLGALAAGHVAPVVAIRIACATDEAAAAPEPQREVMLAAL